MTKQIGSQTNVPDVGDPILSPWYQDTARKIVHPFATDAARNTAIPSPQLGMMCFTQDSKRLYVCTGSAWEIVTEQAQGWIVTSVVQSVPASCTTIYGWSQRSLGVWRAKLKLNIISNGTSGHAIRIPTPFTLPHTEGIGGTYNFYDASAASVFTGVVLGYDTTNFALQATAGYLGTAFGVASGDSLTVDLQGRY